MSWVQVFKSKGNERFRGEVSILGRWVLMGSLYISIKQLRIIPICILFLIAIDHHARTELGWDCIALDEYPILVMRDEMEGWRLTRCPLTRLKEMEFTNSVLILQYLLFHIFRILYQISFASYLNHHFSSGIIGNIIVSRKYRLINHNLIIDGNQFELLIKKS